MGKQRSVQLKVGAFVLVSVAVFVYGVFTISGREDLFEKEYKVRTYFDNTAGLLEGAYVKLSGVGVGSVSSIRFADNPELGKVEVTMEISEPALQRISEESYAMIKTEGLLGAKFIEITPGKGEVAGRVRNDVIIRGETSPEMQEIISQSEEFVKNLISISRNLDKIVAAIADEKNIGSARETLSSIQKTVASIQNTVASVEKKFESIENQEGFLNTLIYDEEFSGNMKDFSENLSEISGMIKEGEGSLGALITDPSVHDSLKVLLGEAERSRFIRSAVRFMLSEKEKRNNGKNNVPPEASASDM